MDRLLSNLLLLILVGLMAAFWLSGGTPGDLLSNVGPLRAFADVVRDSNQAPPQNQLPAAPAFGQSARGPAATPPANANATSQPPVQAAATGPAPTSTPLPNVAPLQSPLAPANSAAAPPTPTATLLGTIEPPPPLDEELGVPAAPAMPDSSSPGGNASGVVPPAAGSVSPPVPQRPLVDLPQMPTAGSNPVAAPLRSPPLAAPAAALPPATTSPTPTPPLTPDAAAPPPASAATSPLVPPTNTQHGSTPGAGAPGNTMFAPPPSQAAISQPSPATVGGSGVAQRPVNQPYPRAANVANGAQAWPAPGGVAPAVGQPAGAEQAQLPWIGATELLEATPVANIDGEIILASEVLPAVDRVLAERGSQIPASQRDVARAALAKQRLEQLIELRLIYNEAMRNIPEENRGSVEDQLNEQFYRAELKRQMELADAKTVQEYDEHLRESGDSLERTKHRFRIEVLAQQWLFREATDESEITHDEMLAYYREHEDEYRFPSRVRWEQLTARFDRVADQDEARRKIAWLGNQVIDGVALADVAKSYSDGPTARSGGQWEWTSQGSLASTVLDEALFALPVGQLSPILEDQQGVHIVRVLERQQAGQTPFLEAQVAIKENIRQERKRAARQEYVDNLRERARIWTIFDEPGAAELFARRPSDEVRR